MELIHRPCDHSTMKRKIERKKEIGTCDRTGSLKEFVF